MLVFHDCLPRYICTPFRAPNRKKLTRRSPKCSPHRTLLGPIGTHLSFNNREDGKVIFFFNVSNLQSFFNVQRTDGMPSVLSGSTKHFSCLPWFCCLSIYEDAQTCFVLCFIVLFCSEDAPLFPYLFCLFFSFCLRRWEV